MAMMIDSRSISILLSLLFPLFIYVAFNPRRFRDGVDLADFYPISVLLRLHLFLVHHAFLARKERREIRKRRLNVSLSKLVCISIFAMQKNTDIAESLLLFFSFTRVFETRRKHGE